MIQMEYKSSSTSRAICRHFPCFSCFFLSCMDVGVLSCVPCHISTLPYILTIYTERLFILLVNMIVEEMGVGFCLEQEHYVSRIS